MLTAALAFAVQAAPVAPVPLYRDPVHDGAADPSIVYDASRNEWVMFYTNRRADLRLSDPKDVSWVHGTAIGVARSEDGSTWSYQGSADIPAACTGPTLWAPEVQRFGDTWHMWLTVVPGIFADWNAPRFLVHLTSRDLETWECGDRLELGSDKVIDASVLALPEGGYRLWFNDERADKAIKYADSPDLTRWTVRGTAVSNPGEGPKAFRWRGRWWLISDAWKGLLVQSSTDGEHWVAQPDHLLGEPGTRPTDRAKAQHPDVVVAGERAYLVYFVHQSGEPEAAQDPAWARRSVLQVIELEEADGRIAVDRTAPVQMRLQP